MTTAAVKTKTSLVPEHVAPLRASFRALQDRLKSFKVAVPQDTPKAMKHSPFNDSPLAAEIDLIFETIAKEGGKLGPYEAPFMLDTADMSIPIVKMLSQDLNLLTVLYTQARKRAERHGVDASYVKIRQRTKILIGGSEI